MTTGPCSSCFMHFKLRPDGTVRMHFKQNGALCAGSCRQPEEQRVFAW